MNIHEALQIILDSLRELDVAGILFMAFITLLQIGFGLAAGIILGAILWRPAPRTFDHTSTGPNYPRKS